MDIKFANFAKSTIADVGGISSGDTTLNVDAGDGDALFPTITGSEYFYCVLVDSSGNREVVKVTARSSDAFTIVRAQDDTDARAFAQSDKVELRFNAGAIEDMVTGIISDVESYVDSAIFEADTSMLFKQNSAPTGWTRETGLQDKSMLCYAASGDIGSGGSADPQSSHNHTGGSHIHSVFFYDYQGASKIFSAYRSDLETVEPFLTEVSVASGSGTSVMARDPSLTTVDKIFQTNQTSAYTTLGNTAPYFLEVIAATKD